MYPETTSGLASLIRRVAHTTSSRTACRVCGGPMEALHRPETTQTNNSGETRVIPASTIVTCKNPNCQLSSFSFEAKTYHTEDLQRYGVHRVSS